MKKNIKNLFTIILMSIFLTTGCLIPANIVKASDVPQDPPVATMPASPITYCISVGYSPAFIDIEEGNPYGRYKEMRHVEGYNHIDNSLYGHDYGWFYDVALHETVIGPAVITSSYTYRVAYPG